jgi:hypothetical protein
MADNAATKQRRRGPGRPFKPGRSGNPKGTATGSRHHVSLLAEKLMADDAEAIVRSVVGAAKAGDMTAARLVFERLVPARKGRTVSFNLPKIETPGDITKALSAICTSVASGELTPDEATAIAAVIEMKRRSTELVELESRILVLEQESRRQVGK